MPWAAVLLLNAHQAACCAPAGDPATVVLAENGTARLPVLGGSLEGPPRELARVLERISGARFAVRKAENGARGILVGVRSDFPWLDLDELDELGPEGFLIRSTAGGLLLVGRERGGVEHAVATFLRRLGCRWFFPGEAWTVIPERATIAGAWDEKGEPSFPIQRRIWYGYGAYSPGRDALDAWNRWNRLGGAIRVGIGHTWHGLDPESEFKEHPEWFALTEGERRPSKPCYSHPEVIRRAQAFAIEQAAAGREMVSMTPPDGLGYCECERCLEVARGGSAGQELEWQHRTLFLERSDGELVSVPSETVFRFVDSVARAVAEKHPETLVGCYAYSAYSHPPSFDIHPNVYVQTTTAFRRTPLDLEETVRAFGRKSPRVGIREYYSAYQWDWDWPDPGKLEPRTLQKDLASYRRLGATAVNAESSSNWAARGLGYYVAACLLWDVEADVGELLRDFYTRAFGPAARAMERYYVRWYGPGAAALEREDALPPQRRLVDSDGTMDAGALRDAYRDLEDAARLVQDLPGPRERVDHLRLYAHYLFLRRQLQEAEGDGDAARILRAIEAETRFAGRITDLHLVHGRALLGKAFLRRFQKHRALLDGVPDASEAGKGWRVRGTAPSREELEALWAEDREALGIGG